LVDSFEGQEVFARIYLILLGKTVGLFIVSSKNYL